MLTITNDNESLLNGDVETDEMCIGNRKYYRGKRQRKNGPIWIQTCVEIDINNVTKKRKVKTIKAKITKDRKMETMESKMFFR